MIPALGRQRQEDLCEFEASLAYRISCRTARATQRNPVWGRGTFLGKTECSAVLQEAAQVDGSSSWGLSQVFLLTVYN